MQEYDEEKANMYTSSHLLKNEQREREKKFIVIFLHLFVSPGNKSSNMYTQKKSESQ